MEHPIGALPRTPFCHYVAFHPQGSVSLDSRVVSLPYESSSLATSRGNKEFEEKNRESYTSCTTPAFPPLVAAPPPCPVGSVSLDSRVAGLPYESSSFATPASGGTITRAYCRAIYEENVSRCFILSPGWGKVRRSRIRGSRAAANHQNAYHAIWQKDLSP